MTIYLVEDDAHHRRAVASHLRAWGYDCVVAADFRDVAGEFQRLQPQLVLLDLLLPFYNGFHWCQEIRRTSQVPILFLSSASDNLNILTAIQMGGDDFLAKPFDLNFWRPRSRRCSAGPTTSRRPRTCWPAAHCGSTSATAPWSRAASERP